MVGGRCETLRGGARFLGLARGENRFLAAGLTGVLLQLGLAQLVFGVIVGQTIGEREQAFNFRAVLFAECSWFGKDCLGLSLK